MTKKYNFSIWQVIPIRRQISRRFSEKNQKKKLCQKRNLEKTNSETKSRKKDVFRHNFYLFYIGTRQVVASHYPAALPFRVLFHTPLHLRNNMLPSEHLVLLEPAKTLPILHWRPDRQNPVRQFWQLYRLGKFCVVQPLVVERARRMFPGSAIFGTFSNRSRVLAGALNPVFLMFVGGTVR